jgi:hypothetical protein
MLHRSLLVLRPSPRPLPTDDEIIKLSARLGGLRIFYHAEIYPLARAASLESSTRFVSSILELDGELVLGRSGLVGAAECSRRHAGSEMWLLTVRRGLNGEA